MATRPTLPHVIDLSATEARRRFGKFTLRPSLAVDATAAGGSFVALQVRWTTSLVPGTLKVVLRIGNPGDADVTAQLQVDDAAMTATGTVDSGGVGVVVAEASGEFLARLAPMRTAQLSATGAAYLPY